MITVVESRESEIEGSRGSKAGQSRAGEAGQSRAGEAGQSVVEFLLMLPLIVGMLVTLVKANTAAQISIVNQQYARSHALFLAYNSPYFPERRFLPNSFVGDPKANQMVIIVGEEADSSLRAGGGNLRPSAPSEQIIQDTAGQAPTNGASQAPTSGASVSKVKILSSVSLCTQSYTISIGNGLVTADKLTNDNVDFRYCAYPFIEAGEQ